MWSRKEQPSPPSEPKIIALTDIAEYYFPDGLHPPREQMVEKLRFFGSIFAKIAKEKVSTGEEEALKYNPSFWISIDSLLPIIEKTSSVQPLTRPHTPFTGNQAPDPKSSEYNISMQMASGPAFHLAVNCDIDEFHKRLLSTLRDLNVLKEADLTQFKSPRNQQLFSMPEEKDRIMVSTLDGAGKQTDKTPLIIIERDEDMYKTPYLSVRLVVDTSEDSETVQEYSSIRNLLSFEIRPTASYLSAVGIISWNSDRAKLHFDEELNVHISGRHNEMLDKPMKISRSGFRRLVDSAINIYQRNPNSVKAFPMGYKDFATSFYYFNLVKVATRLVNQAVICGSHIKGTLAVDSETMNYIREEFENLKDQDRQYVLNTLVWMGFDIWKELDNIKHHLVTAAHHNRDTFHQYFTALGLDQLFSAYRKIDVEEREEITQVSQWASPFSLFPELSRHVDHRPGRENKQSEQYFMNICLALAWYAEALGEEPFGSVVTKNGQIIAAAHNEIKKHGDDPTRHAEIIAIERAKSVLDDKAFSGCKLFTTASPCDMCSYFIREHKGIRRVCIGTESVMGGKALLSTTLTKIGKPFGKPPAVTILDIRHLQDKFRDLYIKKMGWRAQFPDLVKESVDRDSLHP